MGIQMIALCRLGASKMYLMGIYTNHKSKDITPAIIAMDRKRRTADFIGLPYDDTAEGKAPPQP